MKDLIITILATVFAFLITAETKISFQPFQIQFNDIFKGVAVVSLVFSITCFNVSSYRKGNLQAYKEILTILKEKIKNNE